MIFLFVLWLAALFGLGHLYQIPMEFLVLMAFTLIVMTIPVVLSSFEKKHKIQKERNRLLNSDHLENVEFDAVLPKKESKIYQRYQQLIQKVQLNDRQIQEDNQHFYTMWVHEIKLPLSTLQLALEEEKSDKLVLESQLIKMNQLVDMILMYAKQKDNQQDLSIREVKLDTVVRQCVQQLRPLFILNHISLELRDIQQSVLSDNKWLSFMLNQFLSNAIKYSPNGKICIYEEKQELIIEDTGYGISKEDLPRIFEAGYTGQNGHHGQYSSGYGLYLVALISHQLNHPISVESQVGVGTKIHIHFENKNVLL
ncbi:MULTISPECIES: HAMP domain-containing sensor histidine kinase [Terrabacteria group]|uniref:sensor histidine kinase n=1 Tax=Bacillati TaxID=1783272 RepID=UPI001C6E223C|nr:MULTISPECIES: sensor histidine kinase [Terrabacteria group]MBW9212754.1 sensor histidine kinase [Trueperella sp. zg.1013]